MLPRPRPRPDPDVVRARLAALAAGDWATAYAADPRAGVGGAAVRDETDDDDAARLDDVGSRDVGSRGVAELLDPDAVLATRPALRTIVLAVALTALTTWVVAHITAGGAPQPIELAAGTPVPSVSGVLPMPSGGAGGAPGSGMPSSAGGGSGGAAPSGSSASGAGQVVVQVIGQVRRPGLVRLPTGARVADAVAAAGGLRPGGGTGGLNLARVVVDGEQIVVSSDVPVVVGGAGPSAGGGTGAPGGDIVDLNTATLQDLDALPGVGPVMAGRILEWRAAHGRFASIEQLREIAGIGARTFERLKPHVRV